MCNGAETSRSGSEGYEEQPSGKQIFSSHLTGLLALGREPALGPKAIESQLLECLLHLPWWCWVFGQLTGYLLAA